MVIEKIKQIFSPENKSTTLPVEYQIIEMQNTMQDLRDFEAGTPQDPSKQDPYRDLEVKFVKTHPDAILPKKNHPDPFTGDAGYDLFAVETTTIPARGSNVVPVGMKLGYITPGYWFRIEARSGNGFKKSLAPHFGIIDCGYRGDLGVKLYNFSDIDQVIEKGAGAAQIIPYRMYTSTVDWIEEVMVEQSERGEKGFGSSDK